MRWWGGRQKFRWSMMVGVRGDVRCIMVGDVRWLPAEDRLVGGETGLAAGGGRT
jgi:hypothetical protein